MSSSGERAFLDPQHWIAVHDAAVASARLQEDRATRRNDERDQQTVLALLQSGVAMQYSERAMELGDFRLESTWGEVVEPAVIPLDGDFSSAICLFLGVQARSVEQEQATASPVRVSLMTAVGASDQWIEVSREGVLHSDYPSCAWRVLGPFASRLGLQLILDNYYQGTNARVTVSELRLTLGAQRV